MIGGVPRLVVSLNLCLTTQVDCPTKFSTIFLHNMRLLAVYDILNQSPDCFGIDLYMLSHIKHSVLHMALSHGHEFELSHFVKFPLSIQSALCTIGAQYNLWFCYLLLAMCSFDTYMISEPTPGTEAG